MTSSTSNEVAKQKPIDLLGYFTEHKGGVLPCKIQFERVTACTLKVIAARSLKECRLSNGSASHFTISKQSESQKKEREPQLRESTIRTQRSAFAPPSGIQGKNLVSKEKEKSDVIDLVVSEIPSRPAFPLPFDSKIQSLIFRLTFGSMSNVRDPNLGFEEVVNLNEMQEKILGLEFGQRIVHDSFIQLNQRHLKTKLDESLVQQISKSRHNFLNSNGENWKSFCRENLNYLNSAHAFLALSIFAKQFPQLSPKNQAECQVNLKPLLDTLVNKIRFNLQQFPLQVLMKLPELFCGLDLMSLDILKEVTREIVRRSQKQKIPLQSLVNAATALYKFNKKHKHTEILLLITAQEVSVRIKEITPKVLVETACLFSLVSSEHNLYKKVFYQISEEAKFHIFSQSETLLLLKAFSRSEIINQSMESFLKRNAKNLLKERNIPLQELPKIAWAYAKAGFKTKEIEHLFQRIAKEAALNLHNFNPSSLCYLALATVVIDIKTKETDALLSKIAKTTESQIDKFTPRELATITKAFLILSTTSLDLSKGVLNLLIDRLKPYMDPDEINDLNSIKGRPTSPSLGAINAIGISHFSRRSRREQSIRQDILLNLETFTKSRVVQNVEAGEYCIDIVLNMKKKIGIAIEETQEKEAYEKLQRKMQVLEKAGWTIIPIFKKVWTGLKDKSSKIKHLEELLPKTQFNQMCPGFNPEDNEALTNFSWRELFESAKEKNLPTYCISVNVCRNDNKFVYQPYDAIALRNYSKSIKDDPAKINPEFPLGRDSLTCLKILWVETFEIQCFQLDDKMKASPVILEASNFKKFFEARVPEETIVLKDRTVALEAFALDGCNLHAANEKDRVIGRIQYIVGLKLLELSRRPESPRGIEGLRWVLCAAKKDIEEAKDKLNSLT